MIINAAQEKIIQLEPNGPGLIPVSRQALKHFMLFLPITYGSGKVDKFFFL